MRVTGRNWESHIFLRTDTGEVYFWILTFRKTQYWESITENLPFRRWVLFSTIRRSEDTPTRSLTSLMFGQRILTFRPERFQVEISKN